MRFKVQNPAELAFGEHKTKIKKERQTLNIKQTKIKNSKRQTMSTFGSSGEMQLMILRVMTSALFMMASQPPTSGAPNLKFTIEYASLLFSARKALLFIYVKVN